MGNPDTERTFTELEAELLELSARGELLTVLRETGRGDEERLIDTRLIGLLRQPEDCILTVLHKLKADARVAYSEVVQTFDTSCYIRHWSLVSVVSNFERLDASTAE